MVDSPVSTKAALVAALSTEPGYGSQLIERVERTTGLRLYQGSVYPSLLTLEDEGYVRRKLNRNHGRALVYELTRKGERLAVEQRSIVGRLFQLVDPPESGKPATPVAEGA